MTELFRRRVRRAICVVLACGVECALLQAVRAVWTCQRWAREGNGREGAYRAYRGGRVLNRGLPPRCAPIPAMRYSDPPPGRPYLQNARAGKVSASSAFRDAYEGTHRSCVCQTCSRDAGGASGRRGERVVRGACGKRGAYLWQRREHVEMAVYAAVLCGHGDGLAWWGVHPWRVGAPVLGAQSRGKRCGRSATRAARSQRAGVRERGVPVRERYAPPSEALSVDICDLQWA